MLKFQQNNDVIFIKNSTEKVIIYIFFINSFADDIDCQHKFEQLNYKRLIKREVKDE